MIRSTLAPVRAMLRARRSHAALAAALAMVQTACSGDATGAGGITDASYRTPVENAPGTPASNSIANPIVGARFWVDPASDARRTADAWRATRPADAAQLDKVASQPQARWFGDWNATSALAAEVDRAASTMIAAGAMPVFVAYNIPQRDCGSYSANSVTPEGYRAWITAFADGLRGRRAVVVLEPDALAETSCLSDAAFAERLALLRFAVAALGAKGGLVYLDAGQPGWHPAATIAKRLLDAGIADAQGFALNVSNFASTPENVIYGQQISALVGGRHFVVDTGRNGAGSNGQWCNPAGRALGDRPTAETGSPLVDAFLWVKPPGESDGSCNGAPGAGAWMPEYALGLAQRASW